MTVAYINQISTSVPPNDVHQAFVSFAKTRFSDTARKANLFQKMVERAGIEHRYSYLSLDSNADSHAISRDEVYVPSAFPDTATRMRLFKEKAGELAVSAVEKLGLEGRHASLSHIIVACCTGFSAPGIEIEIIERCALPRGIERTSIGFMGCYAAVSALKLARHIVRSEPDACVLVINLELCSLHLQETTDLEKMLSFLLFGDGCAASIVSAKPIGIAIDSFRSALIPDTRELITWDIGNAGFDMVLSGRVPSAIRRYLTTSISDLLGNFSPNAIDLWAVHPGGTSVLDAIEQALAFRPEKLSDSREVLRNFGNMSSVTVMFILERMLRNREAHSAYSKGCALSFGPGLVAEAMQFHLSA